MIYNVFDKAMTEPNQMVSHNITNFDLKQNIIWKSDQKTIR